MESKTIVGMMKKVQMPLLKLEKASEAGVINKIKGQIEEFVIEESRHIANKNKVETSLDDKKDQQLKPQEMIA